MILDIQFFISEQGSEWNKEKLINGKYNIGSGRKEKTTKELNVLVDVLQFMHLRLIIQLRIQKSN